MNVIDILKAGLVFTKEVFTLRKKLWGPRRTGAVNFDILINLKKKALINECVLINYIFSVTLKFQTCCIMGQWGEFTNPSTNDGKCFLFYVNSSLHS